MSEAPPTTVDVGYRDALGRDRRDEGPSSEAFSGPETPRVDIPPAALEAVRAWLVPSPEGPRVEPWSRSRPQGAVEVIVVATQSGAHLRALIS
ncbi:MAG: hypothetical protein MUF34_18040 [Polyangiaceae bacterium]|jgi:hypothetical protein|nr:hypothetical protein [Polyangiaceae bacterium]